MPSGDPTCQTILRNYSDPADVQPSSEPVPDEYKGVCPDFENGPRCCDTNTLKILKFNFNNLLDPTFGSPDGGCSICSANLKRFWCHYNCAPSQNKKNNKYILCEVRINQSERLHSTSLDFPVQLHSESDRPLFMAHKYRVFISNHPFLWGSWRLITESDVYVDINTTCQTFGSCKNVAFAESLGSMSSYQGLFNVFSANGVTQGNVLMNFKYVTQEGALNVSVNNCSQVFESGYDQYNYSLYMGQGWCNCQHCSSNCTAVDFSQYIQQRGLLNGFKFSVLLITIIVAGALIGLGLLLRLATTGSIFSGSDDEKAYHEEQDRQVTTTLSAAQ